MYTNQAQELEEAKEEEYEMKHMSKEGGKPPTRRAPAKKAAAATAAHAGGEISFANWEVITDSIHRYY